VLRFVALGGAAGAFGAGTLTGCDLDPDSSPTSPAVAPPDPDQHILDAARAELRGLLARLPATTGTVALIGCHRRQLAALQGEPPATTRSARPLTRPQVVARERRAAERFTRWALTAQNGDLARVLASVAAGIRMQPVLQDARPDVPEASS
jgi:hypothetical protein